MNQLLAVSWEMPPMYGPRATQVSRTLGALAAMGWQSTVVCLDPRRGGPHWRDGVVPSLPEGVTPVRVPSPEEWFAVRAAFRVAPLLRQLPDSARLWIGAATGAAERAARTLNVAGLVTFARPWSDHLVGLRVKRATRIPWVAHFSDPWVDNPYDRGPAWHRSMMRRMEEAVVRAADALVFVTDETADLTMGKYPSEWRRKAFVVPQGFVPRECPSGSEMRRPGPMRMIHAGRFYSGVRTPLALFQALAKVNERAPLADVFELTLVGPHIREFERAAAALGIDHIVRFKDRVPAVEAATIAADADVLLLIDAPSRGPSVFLPSKLIDYLAFRKPVFGVTPDPGASARLLRRLECPIAPPEHPDAIAEKLSDLIARWTEGRLAVASSFDAVAAEYTVDRTTEAFRDILARTFNR